MLISISVHCNLSVYNHCAVTRLSKGKMSLTYLYAQHLLCALCVQLRVNEKTIFLPSPLPLTLPTHIHIYTHTTCLIYMYDMTHGTYI